MHEFAEHMFTPAVMRIQEQYGSRDHNKRFASIAGPNTKLTDRETSFVQQRDTFYMATVNEDGWPYVQHRGGPPGFLRVLDSSRLGYADFRGNTQLISVGNVSSNNKVSLILMDYPNRRRLKIIGHMQVKSVKEAADQDIDAVALTDYRALVERVVTIDVVAFDWNCPQHITPRYTLVEWHALEADGTGEES